MFYPSYRSIILSFIVFCIILPDPASAADPVNYLFFLVKLLQKAQGTVAIVTAKKDDVLEDQKDVLQQKAEPDISIISRKNHSGNWLNEPDVLFHFEKFLIETNHARKLDLF